jgi:hypothetical protein
MRNLPNWYDRPKATQSHQVHYSSLHCYLLRRLDAGTDWNEGKIAITDNARSKL